MNQWTRLAATSAVALALATPAFAQSTAPTPTTPQAGTQTQTSALPSTTPSTTGSDRVMAQQEEGQILSSDLVGMKVVSAEGNSVGEVSDLILDQQHNMTGAVLSVGGFLGLGSKKIGVSSEAIQIQEKEGRQVVMLGMAEQELADMPEFKTLAEVEADQQRATGTTTGTTGAAPATGGAPTR